MLRQNATPSRNSASLHPLSPAVFDVDVPGRGSVEHFDSYPNLSAGTRHGSMASRSRWRLCQGQRRCQSGKPTQQSNPSPESRRACHVIGRPMWLPDFEITNYRDRQCKHEPTEYPEEVKLVAYFGASRPREMLFPRGFHQRRDFH